jgi:hypothetical protein
MSKFIPPPIPNQDMEQLLFEEENQMTPEEFRAAIAGLKKTMDQRKAYVPTTSEGKEEAFRLAAELFREVQIDLEQDPPTK